MSGKGRDSDDKSGRCCAITRLRQSNVLMLNTRLRARCFCLKNGETGCKASQVLFLFKSAFGPALIGPARPAYAEEKPIAQANGS